MKGRFLFFENFSLVLLSLSLYMGSLFVKKKSMGWEEVYQVVLFSWKDVFKLSSMGSFIGLINGQLLEILNDMVFIGL